MPVAVKEVYYLARNVTKRRERKLRLHKPQKGIFDHYLRSLKVTMSRLNAKAFEFVPGHSFKAPTSLQAQQQSSEEESKPPPPEDRPAQAEAPKPAPTISLNIGGTKPAPQTPTTKPAPPQQDVQTPKPVAPKDVKSVTTSNTSTPALPTSSNLSSTAPSNRDYNFSSEKAKTDADAIIVEQQAKVDSATIADLYGDGKQLAHTNFILARRQLTQEQQNNI